MVLERLREAGYSPSAETADGAVVVRRPDERRTPARPRPPRLSVEPPAPTEALLSAAVRALRAGETADGAPSGGGARHGGQREAAALVDQPDDGRAAHGARRAEGGVDRVRRLHRHDFTERVVEPLRLDGGFLTAYDLRTAEVRTFTVARITGVAAVADPAR